MINGDECGNKFPHGALLGVRNINHKYIVVEMRKYEKSKRDYSVL